MDIHGKQELRELLAAEYALGTLRGGARRRFERWTRSDDALRALTLAWSERLSPLIDSIPSTAPRSRVWERIEARLPGSSERASTPLAAASGWWDRLALWRGLSAAFATVAVIAVGIAMKPTTVVETRIVQIPVQVPVGPVAVATLADPKTGAPVAVVMASKAGGTVQVKVAADVRIPDGQVLQLWTARSDAEGFQSMGLLPDDARSGPRNAQALDAPALAKVKAFGLSLEPAGGSPAPTHVLGLGTLIRLST